MTTSYSTPIAKLTDSLTKLPGVGVKTTARLAFYTIGMSDEDVNEFAKNLLAARHELTYCSACGDLTDEGPRNICTDKARDHSVILVVEDSRNISVIGKIQEYRGLHHVLRDLISPMDGVGLDDIGSKSLIVRLMDSGVNEVIIVTNVTVGGEATSMHIPRVLKPTEIKAICLVRGLVVGSDIGYANEVTPLYAIENRTEL